ncbi:MAG: RsmD family RNA methyltransferase [Spirochaetaceae bacterium]|nr:RsmD family RNA methyltransferase [Spirochaetaceae bacterium]
MRITGGGLAGRRAALPPGVIRPAMDRMRESVFGVLGGISGKSFLDLFSGSGIIALEAASRGAAYVEAVEQDKKKSRTLIQNTQIARPQRIFCRFIACELYVQRAKRRFDIIFCDPPFPYAFKSSLIESIAASPLMRPLPAAAGSPPSSDTLDNAAETAPSRLLLHRPREEKIAYPRRLRLSDRREYGRSIVDFLEYAAD